MNKTIQGRLDRLVEVRQEQDAARVREVISTFLGGLTPETLYECREPDALRPKLEEFLTTQPAKIINTIERWSKNRKGAK